MRTSSFDKNDYNALSLLNVNGLLSFVVLVDPKAECSVITSIAKAAVPMNSDSCQIHINKLINHETYILKQMY